MSKFLKYVWIILPIATIMTSCFFAKKSVREVNYDYNIPRVSENDFDLREYQPFVDSTKAVFLNEKSTLMLKENLPVLDGATALYPLYSAFAQAVFPKKEYRLFCDDCEVQYSNTMQAYDKIVYDKVDIIFVAEPSKWQLENAKKHNVELKKTIIGKEAFVFFVNAKNPVDNLTVEQVQDIYSGKITNWKEVGGNDEEIKAFQRNTGSGSQTAFLNFMKGKKIINPISENVVGGMLGVISRVSDYGNYGNSIGFSFKFFTNSMVNSSEIKILKINGIFPDIQSISNEQYPITGNIYAITNAKNNKENVLKFLDWILSKQGQYLVEKTGYCPIK